MEWLASLDIMFQDSLFFPHPKTGLFKVWRALSTRWLKRSWFYLFAGYWRELFLFVPQSLIKTQTQDPASISLRFNKSCASGKSLDYFLFWDHNLVQIKEKKDWWLTLSKVIAFLRNKLLKMLSPFARSRRTIVPKHLAWQDTCSGFFVKVEREREIFLVIGLYAKIALWLANAHRAFWSLNIRGWIKKCQSASLF